MPINRGDFIVTIRFPRGNLGAQYADFWDSSIQALDFQSTEFDLGDVEPAAVFGRMVDFETAGQAVRLFGREGLVERGQIVGVEISMTKQTFSAAG